MRFPEFSGEWETKSINDLADVIGGGTPDTTVKSYWDGGIQWFTPSEIGKNKFVDASLRTITEDGLNNSSAKLLPPNTILLSSRATIGECSLSLRECATNQGFQSLVSKKCNVDFLYYLIQTKKKDLIRKSCGSTFLEISANEVRKIQVSVPSDVEQQKIAGLLSLIDKRIATQNKIIEDLKKLKSAIVEMLLCNQNGESFKLRDVGCFVRGLTYANEDVTENKAATTVIRANNLNYGNNVDKDEVVYVNKTPTTSQILRKGDIVICMANGSSSLVGKNSYYPFNDGQSTIGAFCGIYRTSYPFVKWLMQSQRYKRLVYQSLQGGNGAIANLNGDDILNMSFPLIENGKSQSIIFAIDAIEKSLMVNKSLQRLYYTQKSYLLKQMFI
ncbi:MULTISPECIES: restriction endonuclease subunit S [Bacteroides]|uniref:restriction endonuclease subunit S n=1 Tax=Bacteroides TaxID=816 RepID=UPI001459CAAF|nr:MULTISPECIES: restriction endonuclease subunit S [Bacteroides]MCB7369168.1 restriction endonuclease subunit S [Bacteroides caccae]NME73888.1 restriction endonuclease subunit S [Bacteroides fragilis]